MTPPPDPPPTHTPLSPHSNASISIGEESPSRPTLGLRSLSARTSDGKIRVDNVRVENTVSLHSDYGSIKVDRLTMELAAEPVNIDANTDAPVSFSHVIMDPYSGVLNINGGSGFITLDNITNLSPGFGLEEPRSTIVLRTSRGFVQARHITASKTIAVTTGSASFVGKNITAGKDFVFNTISGNLVIHGLALAGNGNVYTDSGSVTIYIQRGAFRGRLYLITSGTIKVKGPTVGCCSGGIFSALALEQRVSSDGSFALFLERFL